jgi:integrase
MNLLHLGDLINFLICLKGKGLRETTLKGYSKDLKFLARHVDLNDPNEVRLFVAEMKVKDSYKEKLVTEYNNYAVWKGLSWNKPVYRRDTVLPFIPLEREIDQLIGASRGKTSSFLQFIKESAVRPIEAWRITWDMVDSERSLIYINDPAKHSNPGIFKPSAQLWAMIYRLPRTSKFLFRKYENSDLDDFLRTFYKIRKRTAERLQNPRLLRIGCRTLRHFKATMEYHRTKDILYVMNLLRHKNIKNTLVYTHLVDFGSDEYTCKVAKTIDEASKLIESGFEYVTELEGLKLFKKRK